MNVTLNEWNTLLTKSEEICADLTANGIDVKIKPYTIYNGDKGISFLVLDKCGDVFLSCFSGTGTAREIEVHKSLRELHLHGVLAPPCRSFSSTLPH